MKISKLKIKSYKTIKEIELSINQITTLIVGKNNIGKSNVLKALELFFKNLNDKKNSAIINNEDYRFNTERVEIRVTFDNIDGELNKLKAKIVSEKSKKVNKERLFKLELSYLQLLTVKSTRNKIELILEIKRKDNSKNFKITYNPSETKLKKFRDSLIKRELFEFSFPNKFNDLINDSTTKWDFYNDLKILDVSDEEFKIEYKEQVIVVNKSNLKLPKHDIDTIKQNIIKYISGTQKFLYVPAYRGEKEERNEILDRLFDIIIEDLITTRGITKDFDTITDAIWGTGKFSNKQNIDSVISKRTGSLIEKITKDSISSITGFEFEKQERKDIRKGILKLMIGKPSLYLNDGVKTSFSSKGTGIQSSFMITLMKALSEFEFVNSSDIMLVIEEPEAYTHPQLTREIMDLMLGEKETNTQFIIASHSPVVVNYVKARNIIRLIEKNPQSKSKETINAIDYDIDCTDEDWNLIDRITDVELSEIVFADLVLFVEGEGDKAVLDLILKSSIPKQFHKLSIVSISGNNQIFKLLKLLKYYSIPWLLITDKDSFVERTFEDKIEITERNLDEFFDKFQLKDELKKSYNNVLNNYLVEKIISKSSIATGERKGQLLKKINKVNSQISVEENNYLFTLISDKIKNDFITDDDSLKLINLFNKELANKEIPYYSLESDLEGFVINEKTYDFGYNVYRKYFETKANNFDSETLYFTQPEKIRYLRKCIGSKTSTVKRAPNKSKEVKKPHIPIEIISNYLNSIDYDKDKIIDSFPSLIELSKLIKNKI